MKSIDFAHIGRKLKEIRISKNLTQEYIANMADVNVSHISNIENNRVKISLPMQIASLNGHLCHIWRPACDLNGGQPRTH